MQNSNCLICNTLKTDFFVNAKGVDYFECRVCGSIFAAPMFIQELQTKDSHYRDFYWKTEVSASKERSFGSSVSRVCEVFFYSRIPVKKFLDIGTGPGYLLDALSLLAPDYKDIFYGCELFPPPEDFRTKHKNFRVGSISDLEEKFSAGVCIEVIEHLSPDILRNLIKQLASVSEEGAVFYFNSAQPSFVKNNDPGYLDPHVRGHIVSYSVEGARKLFAEYGFNVIELPGRDWGFLAEYKADKPQEEQESAETLLDRLWTILPENAAVLKDNGFGPLMYSIGLESARCYLEHAISVERANWAKSSIKETSD